MRGERLEINQAKEVEEDKGVVVAIRERRGLAGNSSFRRRSLCQSICALGLERSPWPTADGRPTAASPFSPLGSQDVVQVLHQVSQGLVMVGIEFELTTLYGFSQHPDRRADHPVEVGLANELVSQLSFC